MKMIKKFQVLCTVCAALFIISCAGNSALRMEKLSTALSREDFVPTVQTIKSNPKFYGDNNQFLYNMDIGVLFHYAGLYDSSSLYLEKASQIYHDLFARSLTNEAASLLVNDNVRPYRSKPYELVFLHQIMALNYLMLGSIDGALVESRRTQLLFDEWGRNSGKVDKYSDDPMFHYLSSLIYQAAGEKSNSLISLYKSVDAFNNGPLILPDQIQQYAYRMFTENDRLSDIKLLKLPVDTTSDSGIVASLASGSEEIVVVGYAGNGPSLTETTWWGTYIHGGLLIVHYNGADGTEQTMTTHAPPLPAKEYEKAADGKENKIGTTFHIKFTMPAVLERPSKTEYFTVSKDSLLLKSYILNDIDAMSNKYLEDNKNAILLRTVIRVVVRTIAAEKTKEKLETANPLANLFINFGTDMLSDLLENSDTRSCFLLPKTVHITRLPVTPGSHTIEVAARDAQGSIVGKKVFSDVEVKRGEKKFLIYHSFK